jgi:paired amphipathic helix protein Sin3a
LQKDETTFDLAALERKERWQYYVSSYSRVEDTEGVDRSKMSQIFRNQIDRYHRMMDHEGDYSVPDELQHEDNLVLQICIESSKIIYLQETSDSFAYTHKPTNSKMSKIIEARNERFREKFVQNNKWMQDKSHAEVQQITSNFKKMVDGVDETPAAPVEAPIVGGDIMET